MEGSERPRERLWVGAVTGPPSLPRAPPTTSCGGVGVGAGTIHAVPAFLLPHELAAASRAPSSGWVCMGTLGVEAPATVPDEAAVGK